MKQPNRASPLLNSADEIVILSHCKRSRRVLVQEGRSRLFHCVRNDIQMSSPVNGEVQR
ncbi:MAG: hypothetical protein ACFE0J_11690 [Elainellaceae cyanobacterium]